MSRTPVHLAAVFAASAGMALTASQTQAPSFVAGNRTVAVYATVTNAQGRLVTDLSRSDFTIDDTGKPQPLTLFSNDIQPITVVMLLDRSGSMKSNFQLEEQAAEAFVRAMLPRDKARIGSFATRIQVDPDDFTSSPNVLMQILHNDLQDDGPTPLWNAVDTAIDKLLLEPGRRVVLVFTDGVDMPLNFSGRNKSLKDVMKRAEEDDIMVYAIGLAGQNGMRGQFGGQSQPEKPDEGLPKIAAATGGGYFELTSPRDLAYTFAHIADELHGQYALGFTPEKLDGKMHDIAVHLAKAGLTARARKRYLAQRLPGGN